MERVILLLAAVAMLLLPQHQARADTPWTQWMHQDCAMARHSWLSLSQSPPGFGWMLSPGSQSNPTFAEGAARLDFLRLSQAQADSPFAPSFRSHCCHVRIWENLQTGQTAIMPDGDLPGFGFTESPLSKPAMCCEEASFVLGSDPLNCTQVKLMSVPGAVVVMTPTGPVSPFGPVTIPTNPPTVIASSLHTPPPTGVAGYVGCFKDPNNPFDLDGYLERSAENTPQRCIDICRSKGFAYAGVQYSESCLCGNRYGQFGAADNCTMTCTGDGSQTCGGINSNNVYATGL